MRGGWGEVLALAAFPLALVICVLVLAYGWGIYP